MRVLAVISLLILFSACQSRVTDKEDPNLKAASVSRQIACEKGKCPCDTPIGTILHGSKVSVYSMDKVSCQSGCGQYKEELTCNNGSFDKDIVGKYFKCEVEACPACSLGPNLILSGETIDAFSVEEVGCRESCEDVKQRRTCNAGALSGTSTYKYTSCKRKTCRCTLPGNNGFVSLDGTIRLYSSQQAACGTTCDGNLAQDRTCNAHNFTGVETYTLSGSDTYRFPNCNEAAGCSCTLPGGLGVMNNNEVKTVWSVASVPCGQSCATQPSVTVKCLNGVFKDNTTNATVDFNQAPYTNYRYNCAPASCDCTVPGLGTSISNGAPWTFAKEATVGCNAQCETEERTCQNGVFVGGNPTIYPEPTCTRRVCACPVPGYMPIDVGSYRRFWSAPHPACGQSCDEIKQDRQCTESPSAPYTYQFTGDPSYSYPTCSPPSGCSCILPGTLGPILDGTIVRLVTQSSISCGTTCDSIPSVEVRCSGGQLLRTSDGGVENTSAPGYPYQYFCNQATCADCALPGFGTIPNQGHRVLYSKDPLGCGDVPALFTYTFACQNGVLLRNGVPYNPLTDPNAPSSWSQNLNIDCPGCPLPWGGSIAVGTTINAYKYFGTVINNCGRGCKVTQRTCLPSGQLDGESEYNMASCDNSCTMEGGGAPPRACLLRWQNSYVTPDAIIPVWNRKTVGCNDSCQNHFRLSRCKMEKGNFDAPSDYLYQSCTEVCP